MSRYYYRGTNWSLAKDEELGVGKVFGDTYTIYAGVFEFGDIYRHISPGTPVDTLPWFTPDDFTDQPYITRRRGITGGLSESLSQAIGFASGIPFVFYINQSSLNGTGARVRYDREFMTEFEGALAHIIEGPVSGELRDQDEGIVGLTRASSSEPEVHRWGADNLNAISMSMEEEREVIVPQPDIDLLPCCDAIAILQPLRRGVYDQLTHLDGPGVNTLPESAYPVHELTLEEAQDLLHQEIRERSAVDPQGLISLAHSGRLTGGFDVLPEDRFEYAYTQQDGFLEYDEVPGYILGEL